MPAYFFLDFWNFILTKPKKKNLLIIGVIRSGHGMGEGEIH